MTGASEETPVVIIGAGPAGLAAAECLRKRRIRSTVLEAGPKVAAALRHVDPEMRLLSPTSLSLMPDMQRRLDEPNYLPFGDLVKELERYARQHELEIISGATVVAVETRATGEQGNGGTGNRGTGKRGKGKGEGSGEGFTVTYETSDGETTVARSDEMRQTIFASHVINASGIISHPQLPAGFNPEQVSFRWLHSLDARASDLKQSRRLLVIGGGASAAEVLEGWLAVRQSDDHAWLSLRSPLRSVPHWILGVDIHYLGWLPEQLPACLLGWRAGRLHEPMTGLKVKRAIRRKIITRLPGVAGYESDGVVFTDGTRLQPDLVVFATGFRYETRHLQGLLDLDPDGRPLVRNCESTRVRGLYLLGFRYGRTFASPYLRGIARDAEYVAKRIARERSTARAA